MIGLVLGFLVSAVTSGQSGNGYDDYLRASRSFVSDSAAWKEVNSLERNRGSADFGVKVRQVATRFEQSYQLVVAGNAKPVSLPSDVAFDDSRQIGDDTYFRTLVALCGLRSEAMFAAGRPDEGYESLLTGLMLSRNRQRLQTGYFAISGFANLVGVLTRWPMDYPPSLAESRAIQGAMTEMLQPSDFGARWERETEVFDRDLAGSLTGLKKELGTETEGMSEGEIRSLGEDVLARMKQELPRIEGMNSMGDLQLLKSLDGFANLSESGSAVEKQIEARKWMMMNSMAQEIGARTYFRILRVMGLVWEYRWAHGKLPETLSELSSADVVDPLTGKPFGYEVKGGTFDVWSAGYRSSGEIRIGPGLKMVQLPAGQPAPPAANFLRSRRGQIPL